MLFHQTGYPLLSLFFLPSYLLGGYVQTFQMSGFSFRFLVVWSQFCGVLFSERLSPFGSSTKSRWGPSRHFVSRHGDALGSANRAPFLL